MSLKEVKLGELVFLRQGFALNIKSQHYISDETGLPLLKISDLFNNTETLFVKKEVPKQFLVFEDEIIYSRTGQVGYAFMGKRGVIYNNCFKVIPNEEKINKIFLYKLLNTEIIRNYAQTLATGTAQLDLNHDAFKSIKIKLPSLNIQQKIVNLISNYDNLIENNNKRIKLLENIAEELYKEWFVRLRFPNYQNTKIVDGIPDGWEEKNLFDISDVLYGYPLKSSLFNEDKLGEPIVRIRDIKNNSINTFTTERIKDEKYYLKNGDFIVGMDGDFHVGKWSGGKAILNQRVVCFRVDDFVSKYFFYFSVKKEIDYLDSVISGTTVAHLSDRDLKKINILIPSAEVMNKFKSLVDNLYKLEIDLKVKNQNLKETRDLLLPRLISGKLDIKDLHIV